MYLMAATFSNFENARDARRAVMVHFSLPSFDAQLDIGHGDAMVVFRVNQSDRLALRDEIAQGAGKVVYERALGARLL